MKTATVFVIEDDELMLAGLRASLGRLHHLEVLGSAMDGRQGLDNVLRMRPDIAIVDIGLPFMDGIEVTERIKHQLDHCKVLMLTSHDDDNNLFSAFAAGADGYVLKDSGIQTLDLAINTVLGGAVWLDSRIAKRVLQYAIVSAALSPPAAVEPIIKLTERETEVLRFMCDGMTNAEIAERLNLTTETVKTHVSKIMHKLAVNDRTQAAVKAVRSHLI